MLEVTDVSVSIGGVPILTAIDLRVSPGEVVVVLGPSGGGKSTLLRAIAGLQDISGGEMSWDGSALRGLPPHRRGFGLMFQDLALFPHRTVAGNVAFGLEMKGEPNIEAMVDRALELVSLSGMGDRSIDTLSGGEQQRVALARALAPRPLLLMFDEPLGSLDRVLRQQLTTELRGIFDGLDTAVLYVTHDQEEALSMADRIIILDQGRVVQAGTPEDIWRRPATEFVASFVGWEAIADGDARDGLLSTPWGDLATEAANGPIRVALAPRAAAVDPSGDLTGIVESCTFSGSGYTLRIQPVEGPTVEVFSANRETPGRPVRWTADLGAVVAFRV